MTLANYRKMYSWKWLNATQVGNMVTNQSITEEEAAYIKTGVVTEGIEITRVI